MPQSPRSEATAAPRGRGESRAGRAEPEDAGLQELREIQRAFSTALFRPLGRGDRMQSRADDGRPMHRVAEEFIRPNERLSSFERLEIYNRVYWFRIWDAMYDDFPAVRAVLGQRAFHRLITAYLAEFPSTSYTLRDLGSRFSDYLLAHPELLGPEPLLAQECARFEWAQVLAFDEEARPPLALDAALGQDPSTLQIALQPYLVLLELVYPVDQYVLALRRRDRVRESLSNTATEQAHRPKVPRVRKPQPERTFVAVHRQDNTLYYKRLSPGAFTILRALQLGETLAAACEAGAAAANPEEELATAIQQWFHDWATMGWLCTPAEAN